MKVTVVGGGIIGLTAARSLLRAGHAVTLLDQGPLPNPVAASSDHHRLIRYTYGPARGYAAMVAAAFPAWERLWQDLGRCHYAATGQLIPGRPDDPWLSASRRSLEALGIAFEELDRAAIARQFPVLATDTTDYALHTADAGALYADAIAHDLVAWLAAAGCTLCPDHRALDIDVDRGRVALAAAGTIDADHLVIAAGAWTAALLPEFAPAPVPSRQAVLHAEAPAELAAGWAGMPVVTESLEGQQASVFYAFPPLRGHSLKLGDHCFSKGGDPADDRTATADEIGRIRAAARRRLRRADDYRLIRAKTCFYTLSRDERFIAWQSGRATMLTGFSGHGYKFAPLIAERLAEMLDGRLAFTAFGDWLAGRETMG